MSERPTISLVTPSFNQAEFLSETLLSVLGQKYPQLEYGVMDGGSSDGSIAVIERHASQLSFWESKPDAGQYAAINEGFARTSGEVMGWLNSDDKHLPWCLEVVGEIFAQVPEVEWLTTAFPLRWDAQGRAVNCRAVEGYSRELILRGDNLPGASLPGAWPIQQESTFWRRGLWERAGGQLSTEFGSAGDYELWLRFAKLADPVAVKVPLAGFRQHGAQQTSRAREAYQQAARRAWERQSGRGWTSVVRWWRWWAREQKLMLPKAWLGRLGLLHRGWVVERTRDNSRWVKREVWV